MRDFMNSEKASEFRYRPREVGARDDQFPLSSPGWRPFSVKHLTKTLACDFVTGYISRHIPRE